MTPRSIPVPTGEQDQRHAQLEELLKKAIAGDEKARNQLLEALLPRLRDQVRRTLNAACRDARSDVLCSVVRRVCAAPLPPTLPHFLGMIGLIVRNRCHDEWGKWKRDRLVAPLADPEGVPGTHEGEAEAAAREKEKERKILLMWSALQLLKDHHRQVLEDTYYARMSSKDIGAKMGLGEGAVRVLRCRALKELRQLMEKCDANE